MEAQEEFLRMIYPVSRETFQRLKLYVERLKEWQVKTNLVASSTLDEIWERHIADSLQCVALKPDCRHWVDIGSGGGLPALVINAVMIEHSDYQLAMVESIDKKCAFLRQVNRQMDGKAKVYASRIESVAKQIDMPEIVTARALATLPKLLELSSVWLMNGAIGLFHKGREFRAELEECNGLWSFDLVEHESKIAEDSVILEISNLQRI